MSCKDCGHENASEARFCAGCGTPLASPSEEGDPLLGQVVGGRYRIVKRIGEGGMGVVYEAEQKLGSTVRKVAVKTLHAELSQDPSITARFHREVGTVASLEHPNTVRVYDFGSTPDGTLYIAMEHLNGVPLNEVIEKHGTLDATRVARILKQISGSLDEAHNKGIVHRDLKPENVLLIERAGEQDVVKLVDFGIAARTESAEAQKEQKLTKQGMVLGTPPYMSPEQFSGKPLDGRSDIYSLGIMTYEMLTGTLPFHAETPWQWATHHMTSEPKAFEGCPGGSEIPAAARAAVLRALSKSPADRQDDAGSFFEEFQTAKGSARPPVIASPAAGSPAATQAMAEQPAAFAATQAMPQADEVDEVDEVDEAESPSRGPAPVVVGASPRNSGRSLVYALAGFGGLLLVAMGIVAVSSGNDDLPAPDSSNLAAEPLVAGTAINAAPVQLSPEAPVEQAPVPELTAPSKPSPTRTAPKAKKPKARPKAKPTSRPKSTTKPKATAKPKAKSPKPAASASPAKACQLCTAAVAQKDIVAAGRHYAQCTNRKEKARCRARATRAAPTLATQKAYNGKCTQAKVIIAAAIQMGVTAKRFSKAQAECK